MSGTGKSCFLLCLRYRFKCATHEIKEIALAIIMLSFFFFFFFLHDTGNIYNVNSGDKIINKFFYLIIY